MITIDTHHLQHFIASQDDHTLTAFVARIATHIPFQRDAVYGAADTGVFFRSRGANRSTLDCILPRPAQSTLCVAERLDRRNHSESW